MTPERRILSVEGDAVHRELMTEITARIGIPPGELLFATSAAEARQTLQTTPPKSLQLILMDLDLPDADGLTFIHEIRATQGFEATPLIALAAPGIHDLSQQVLDAGANAFIPKPFHLETVEREIKHALQSNIPPK